MPLKWNPFSLGANNSSYLGLNNQLWLRRFQQYCLKIFWKVIFWSFFVFVYVFFFLFGGGSQKRSWSPQKDQRILDWLVNKFCNVLRVSYVVLVYVVKPRESNWGLPPKPENKRSQGTREVLSLPSLLWPQTKTD